MAGRKTRKEAAQPFGRYLPIAILIALLIFVGAVVAIFFSSPEPGIFHYPAAENASGCVPGQVEGCSVGRCSGMSTCLQDGTWGGCNWQRVCIPGSRAPCLQNGCAYAYKECNQCGSGYGDCNASKPATSDAG